MKIGELAKQSGISAHTLRFYEKQGLLKASHRTQSNYRVYSETDLNTAKFIKRCRDIGFSLDEAGVFLSIRADKPAHVCADAKQITDIKITEVTQKISELQDMLIALHKLSDACCGGVESAELCSILDTLEKKPETDQEVKA